MIEVLGKTDRAEDPCDVRLLSSTHKLSERLIHGVLLGAKAANALGFGQKPVVDLEIGWHAHTLVHTFGVSRRAEGGWGRGEPDRKS